MKAQEAEDLKVISRHHLLNKMGLSLDEAIKFIEDNTELSGDCLEWTGTLTGDGYGYIKKHDLKISAHRFVFALCHRCLQESLFVMHVCDNPKCVRPEHLVAGSHGANMFDMKNKGRSLKGAQHPSSKLNQEMISKMKEMAFSGMTHKEIARKFGVSRSTASKAISGASYE